MPKTILLADDSVTIQKVVGISFASEDVVLLTVDNGDDAVSRAREARPDLVLADVMMPGRDGYDVCETLKADPELRHVPVLLLSGTFEPYDEERAGRAGADGHITKPFEAQALVDQVNALLARAASPMPASGDAPSDETVLVANPADGDPDGAFDFFDDEMARTAPSPAPSVSTLVDDDDDAAALELEAAVDEDGELVQLPSSSLQPHEARLPGDSQATALFVAPEPSPPLAGEWSRPGWVDEPGDAAPLSVPASEAATVSPPAMASEPASLEAPDAPADYEESFEFGFGEEEAAEARIATPRTESPEAAPFARAPAPQSDLVPDPFDEPAVADLATTDPLPNPPEGPLSKSLEVPPPIPEPMTSRFADPTPPPVPAAAAEVDALVAIPVGGAARPTALSEPIQKQLQETLEKIVWEAFGDVTERIVRDVIERVEAVAWEVIPQMTETLVREELRRLQDDSEES